MESIGINPTAKFKVLTFFRYHPTNQQFFISEVAEALELTPTSVKSAVEELRNEGVLDRIERGGMKFYQTNDVSSIDLQILKAADELKNIIHADDKEKGSL